VLEHRIARGPDDAEVEAGVGAAICDEALVVVGIEGEGRERAQPGDIGRSGTGGGERGGLRLDDRAQLGKVMVAIQRDRGDAVAGVGREGDEFLVIQPVERLAERRAGNLKAFAELT